MTRRFGWVPDLPDHRDFQYKVCRVDKTRTISLRAVAGPVWDQGELGSCTGHGVGRCDWVVSHLQGEIFMPSRLMLYYNGRKIENNVRRDDGAMIRDVVKGLAKIGVCDEARWPYNPKKFASSPSKAALSEASLHQAMQYERVPQSVSAIRSCLNNGLPVVFGATLYSSFDTIGESGLVPMPRKDEGVMGGHCMAIIGHDPRTKRFEVINSWGTEWGDQGYCWFPEAYLLNTNLSDDFWVIRVVE